MQVASHILSQSLYIEKCTEIRVLLVATITDESSITCMITVTTFLGNYRMRLLLALLLMKVSFHISSLSPYIEECTAISTDSTCKSPVSVHTSMYSYIYDATFINNSPSKSHISVVSSTCSDGDHTCDATFITYSTSK